MADSTADIEDEDHWPEQLAVRIARCYYENGMTQQDIALKLGIGRARVIRLLSEARSRGIVSIQINSPLLETVELAETLAQRYTIDWAEVAVSYAESETGIAAHIANTAARCLPRYLHDNMTIGIGWGETLQLFAQALPHQPRRNVSVTAMLGSLTRRSSMNQFEATTALSAKLDAECLYLPGPIVCDNPAAREILASQPLFQDVYSKALESDIAIVSVGGLDSATIRRVNFVSDADFISVEKAGAIGNFLGYYIDYAGNVIDHEINQRVLGVRIEQFRDIDQRIMISGGKNKVPALKAILARGLITALVTDEMTARALLE